MFSWNRSGVMHAEGLEFVGEPGEPGLVETLAGVAPHEAVAPGRVGDVDGELVPGDDQPGGPVPVEALGVVGQHAQDEHVVVRVDDGGRPVGAPVDDGKPVDQRLLVGGQPDRRQPEGLGVAGVDEGAGVPGVGELGGDVPAEEVRRGGQVAAARR